MSWSFDDTLSTDRDLVRILIGDTNTNDQLMSNESIDKVLTLQTNVNLAAARCCEMIAAKYARQVNTTNMSLSVQAADRYAHYIELATTLRDQDVSEAIQYATIKPGGLTISEKNTLDADTDARQPSFSIGMDDLINLRDTGVEEQ